MQAYYSHPTSFCKQSDCRAFSYSTARHGVVTALGSRDSQRSVESHMDEVLQRIARLCRVMLNSEISGLSDKDDKIESNCTS